MRKKFYWTSNGQAGVAKVKCKGKKGSVAFKSTEPVVYTTRKEVKNALAVYLNKKATKVEVA